MAIQQTEFIWRNGELVSWHEAQVHVLTHALHYGSSIFEGIRAYSTPSGTCFFRLDDHIDRLIGSSRIHRHELPFSREQLIDACHQTLAANELESAYVRPLVFRGYGTLSVDPTGAPTEVIIATVPWGAYLGEEGMQRGVDVCVSSWQRVAPNTIPVMAKAGGNYLSATLINMEAKRLGFDEGLALTPDGTVGEGSGENLFVVQNGTLLTPPASGSILPGFTRDAVRCLAQEMQLEYREVPIPRELLYTCDEIFLTGTAAEITPVRSVDRIEVGGGGRGPITQRVQEAFFGLFDGTTEDRWGWLQAVRAAQVAR
jgi:branched-chain amino acid aminotransferase